MSLDQRIPIPPLRALDRRSIKDTFSAFQQNFSDLFQAAHEHTYRTTAPGAADGEPGNIFLVNLDGTYYLYAKFPDPINWARVEVTQV